MRTLIEAYVNGEPSKRQLRLLPESCNRARAALHRRQPTTRKARQLSKVLRVEVNDLMALEEGLHVLHRWELGRIGGQLLELNGVVLRFNVTEHHPRAVSAQAVPDGQLRLAELSLQSLQELDYLGGLHRARKQPGVDTPPCDPGHRRELAPIEVILERWRLPERCPGARARRPLTHSRFVEEDDRAPLFIGVFFSPGRHWRFQVRIAASSRSKTRLIGRWGVNPSRRRSRNIGRERGKSENADCLS